MSAAPVARLLDSKVNATFPPANLSPMIPDPTTVASKRGVPTASAVIRRARLSRFLEQPFSDKGFIPRYKQPVGYSIGLSHWFREDYPLKQRKPPIHSHPGL